MSAPGVPGPDHAPDLAEAKQWLQARLDVYREAHAAVLLDALDRAHRALKDAVFGLDRAAEMTKDPTVRRDFAELAARARDALARELDPTRKDEG